MKKTVKKDLSENKKIDKGLENFAKDFYEDLVRDVTTDFEQRRRQRKNIESQWQLNANFVAGNQYCDVNVLGEIENEENDFYWRQAKVYNHVASILETRLAKLSRVRPKMSVRPASNNEDDVKAGKVGSKVLSSICNKIDIEALIAKASMWSELCGSVFYKISWDSFEGKMVGSLGDKKVFEGDVRVDVCPPYEIFPSSLYAQDITDLDSIIHAKVLSVDEIKNIWGVNVEPQEVDILSLNAINFVSPSSLENSFSVGSSNVLKNSAIIIERYTMPSKDKENGELVIVAGDKILYYSDLPYINGDNENRVLPFVKQDSISKAGSFFGVSMIERSIPIQRSYNAVKNRKHEFLNRIATGVLAVEDGSVDVDDLQTDGLSPGKILVYRQGSTLPRMLDYGAVPSEFSQEEDRLLKEFMSVTGVSDLMRSSSVPASVTSGVALQMLIEQDDTRLTVTAEKIRVSIKNVARHILRLYKQFAINSRLCRVVGQEGEVELLYWNNSDISCDDVIFDTENELSFTPAARQGMMLDLFKMGLLHDENGKLSDAVRYKILDTLGYGGWENLRDIQSLNYNRAEKENIKAIKEPLEVLEIDEHEIHILEHKRFMLGQEFEQFIKKDATLKDKMLAHIREHKQFLALEKSGEQNEKQ